MGAVPTFDDIVTSMSRARPPLRTDEQSHALTLLRTLAEGQPVSPAMLASRTGQPAQEASALVDRLPGVYRDDQNRVVGFWGLTVAHMPPHRYRLDGRELFTWCAWDPFILTPLLGGQAEVSSVDAHAGDPISFRIAGGAVTDLSHPGLVLSYTLPGDWTEDVIANFCHVIHFFTGEDAAGAWIASRPGTFVLGLEDAIALGEVWRRQVLPDVTRAGE